MSALRDEIVVSSIADLDDVLFLARRANDLIGFVPTLGGLHDGHVADVRMARAHNDVVVVSIFLNPLQFEDPGDLARYPADPASDVRIAVESGAGIVFAPSASEIYPAGAPQVVVDPGPDGDVLEGASRPGHFRGVATVVTKLLSIVRPSKAYFGEKDYQQLVIVRRLVRDLSIPTSVVACPTVRAADGLALSSRNALLSAEQRTHASSLYRALQAGRAAVENGATDAEEIVDTTKRVIDDTPDVSLDYLTVVAEGTLDRVATVSGDVRLLVAACVGDVRLIDNVFARYPGQKP